MKKFLFVIVFTIVSLGIRAQGHFVGVKTGVHLTNILSANATIPSDSRVGFSGGFSYEYMVRDRFSVGADLLYNQRGFSSNFLIVDGSGNPVGAVTVKYHYDYLSFPIRGGFYLGKKAFGYGQIGVVPSLLMGSKVIPGSDNPSIHPQEKQFDLAGLIELGAGYKLNRVWLSLFAIYQQSFTTFTEYNTFGVTEFRHEGLTFSIGAKYQLRKL